MGDGRDGINPVTVGAWNAAIFCALAAALSPDTAVDPEKVTTATTTRSVYAVVLLASVTVAYAVFDSGGLHGTMALLVMAVFGVLVVNQLLVNVELRRLHRSNEQALSRMAASERRFRACSRGRPSELRS